MNNFLKQWTDRAHHLEKLLNSQKKIIADLQNQLEKIKENKYVQIPNNILIGCCCCNVIAESIAPCGHAFCTICIDRGHDSDCIACEEDKEMETKDLDQTDICKRLEIRINSDIDNPIVKNLMKISIDEIEALRKRTRTLIKKIQDNTIGE
jgi:hypothetical protein